MSSGLRTIVARPAQYTACRSSRPTASSASANVTTFPSGTAIPTPRTIRANAGANRAPAAFFSDRGGVCAPESEKNGLGGSGSTLHRGADEFADADGPHPFLILAVLEHRSQRGLDGVLVEVGAAERGQRHGPVDGLGHSGRLVQLEPAHPL